MDTFKTVVQAAKAAGAEAWLPALVEANMTRPTVLATHGADPPVPGMPAETWQQLSAHSAQLPGAGRGRPTRKIYDPFSSVKWRGSRLTVKRFLYGFGTVQPGDFIENSVFL